MLALHRNHCQLPATVHVLVSAGLLPQRVANIARHLAQ